MEKAVNEPKGRMGTQRKRTEMKSRMRNTEGRRQTKERRESKKEEMSE